jgi:hypothetical protein
LSVPIYSSDDLSIVEAMWALSEDIWRRKERDKRLLVLKIYLLHNLLYIFSENCYGVRKSCQATIGFA